MNITEDYLRERYNKINKKLIVIKNEIVDTLEDSLSSINYLDCISGRVKSKKSFMRKALSDTKKYHMPFKIIEDIIGVRLLVLFTSVAREVSEKIKNDIFPEIEYEYRESSNPKTFEYEGYQSIHSIPTELISLHKDDDDFPNVFELQVRTLFQHAWLEPEHEINYKNREKIKNEKKEFEYNKKFSWLAATAWGSDKILEEQLAIYKKLNKDK